MSLEIIYFHFPNWLGPSLKVLDVRACGLSEMPAW